MNKIYQLVWSKTKKMWISVSEMAASGWFRRPLVSGSILLIALLTAGGSLWAIDPGELPSGGYVTSGQADISQNGSSMTVNQYTDKMSAEWDTFNIGQDASVDFMQPGSSSVALNRIHDQNPSQIFGRLSSNGQVFLLNPSGIYFGPTARVDVGGLVASSLNISDEDFLKGKYSFESSGDAGAIRNDGNISALNGGYLAFIAPEIKNTGLISADKGSALFAAGDRVNLDFAGDGLVTFTVDKGAIDAQIENRGLIQAKGGTVIMTAKAADDLTGSVINNSGIVEAQGVTEQGGRIFLFAEGGQATISGALNASSDAGAGGNITVTGERVLVESGAHLNASGITGGGDVLVGGSWQGSDPTIHQAEGTVIEQGALLEANATDKGDGGTVVAWSDVLNPNSVTRAYGAFEAKGGPNGGNGGRIETSGHWLDVAGVKADASAANGKNGEWLLDPWNIIIGGSISGTAYSSTFVPGADSTILATDIAVSLQGGTDVTITTGTTGSSIGDITVSNAITKASGDTNVTLTLNAANSIVVDQAISNTGGTGKLNLVLDADNNNGVGDGAGIIILNSDINTNGGNLSFGTGRTATIGGVSTLVGGDVFVGGSAPQTISTNGGAVDIRGEMLIANTNGLSVNSSGGNIRFYGLLNSANSYTGVTYSGTWSNALSNSQSGAGNAVGSTYLATITSRLENSIASRAVNYQESWLGARRVTGIGTDNQWRWVTGPEGTANSGAGTTFFIQTGNGIGNVISGYFSNWSSSEPNNYVSGAGNTDYALEYESVLQFTGTQGQWNDLTGGPSYTINTPQTLSYYVKETNQAASPLTINAGAGTVTFSGAVGTSKALASLDVTSTSGIAINGGAVTTEGLQTYNGNVTLGSASTTLTQTNANVDFTLATGKSITNATGADADLTIKTTRSIIMESGSLISSSSGRLNTIMWSDSDGSDSGHIYFAGTNSISTNGGGIWMGGGSGTAQWTPYEGAGLLTVGNGYAVSDGTYIGGEWSYRGGIEMSNATNLTSSGGNINLYGKGYDAPSNFAAGVYFRGGTIDAGTGKIVIDGISRGSGEGLNSQAVSMAAAVNIKSTNAGADAITITGDASSAVSPDSAAIGINMPINGTIQSTGGGGITLIGKGGTAPYSPGFQMNNANVLANSGPINFTGVVTNTSDQKSFYGGDSFTIGYKAGTDVTASTSDITLTGDTADLGGSFALSSAGKLLIQPYTALNTIGIAGGTGTLSLPASYFSTNFTNGFSSITIGSANAGNINIGNTALTYNDPLTLKTAGNITTNSEATVTGGMDQTAHLTLWADADANNDGYIFLYDGSAIDTNGGDIVMAGGADGNSDGRPDGFATSATSDISGVSIGRLNGAATAGTTILSDGGDIFIKGKSSGGGVGMGINYSHSGVLDAGSGTLTMIGESSSYNAIELSAWIAGVAEGSYLDINANTISMSGISSASGRSGLNSSQLNNRYTRITSGPGGISFYGENTADTSKGISVSLNASTSGGDITMVSPNNVELYTGSNNKSINAGTGDISITANTLSIQNGTTLSGNGTLAIEPYTAGRAINIGTTGANTLDIASSYFFTNFTNGFSDITIGNATSGATTVGSATTFNDNITLINNSNIAINGAVTANENLTLTGNGAVSQTAALNIIGNTAITAGSANNITLSNVGNNFNGAVSVTSGNNVSIIDSNTMTLSSINVDGEIDIATLTGDLSLTSVVTTTNATADAISLNAGKNTAAGTSTGGNILISGGSINFGAGGTAKLYSGDVSDSTGLAALVGSGSGRFRYNADETTDFSSGGWTALNTGLNAIYREQPIITVTPSSGQTVTYGSGPGSVYTHSGYLNGDSSTSTSGTVTWTLSGTLSTAGYATVGTHDIIYSSGLTNSLGYGFSDNAGSTDELTVNQRSITISGITATNKVYDANTTATVDTTGAAGWLAGDTVTVSASGLFDNKNVGTGKTVNLTSSYGGGDLGNYSITDQATTTANITQRLITISGITAANKVYDANTTATVDTTSAAGWLAGDAVTVSASGLFENKDVGTGKTVNLTSSYGGADAGNYSITNQATTTADITQRAITISGITATNKVYDTNTTATVDTTGAAGWIVGDTVTVSASGLFDNKNVGTGKTVTLTSSYGGTDLGNYSITNQATTTADITQRPINISGITAANKVYDANRTATVDTTGATGWLAGDTVTVSASGLFDNKNVGTGKTVTLTSTYGGADSGNYSITDQATTTANITQRAITISGITAENKVYDANRTATVDTTGAAGWLAGDTVTVSASGLFDNKDVGAGKTINLTSSYGGADTGNYSITDQATTTANITQRAINISGITAANKVYDANTTATVDTTSAAGWLAGDTVTVSASGLFDNKDVGAGKTINLTSSYGGADAGNYSITDQATTTANITQRAINISGITAANKVYDANTTATVDTTGASGWLAGDTVTVSASGLFDNKNVGTGKTVTLTSSYGGTDLGNYSITDQATTTANITQKSLTATYTGIDKVYDGTTNAQVAAYSADVIAGDIVNFIQSAAFTDKDAGIGKTIDVTDINLSGIDSANYNLQNTTSTTTANIAPALLTVTASDDTRVFNNVTYSGGNGVTYTGFVNNETNAILNGILEYGGTSQGAVNPGLYDIEPFGLTSNNYDINFLSGQLAIISETNVEIDMVSRDRQNGINSTGQDHASISGGSFTSLLGPGAGSSAMAGYAGFEVMSLNITETGAFSLSSESGSTIISFMPGPEGGSIMNSGGASSGEIKTIINSMPVFEQIGPADPVWINNYTISKDNQALSAAPNNSVEMEVLTRYRMPEKQYPFTLNLQDGMSVQYTAGITDEGYMVISFSSSHGGVDIEKIILMGIAVVEKEIKEKSDNIRGVVIVKRPHAI
ncbi:MAG: filamentous hemagglutinin N-terminal domain-containing protein [Desulfatiglans sp.]|nr:filamentous hemagglutinin N-terminal domain-containing protein [Desulfatiglans sp.]